MVGCTDTDVSTQSTGRGGGKIEEGAGANDAAASNTAQNEDCKIWICNSRTKEEAKEKQESEKGRPQVRNLGGGSTLVAKMEKQSSMEIALIEFDVEQAVNEIFDLKDEEQVTGG
eukprot:12417151-Karenia_brevis.AAC.1